MFTDTHCHLTMLDLSPYAGDLDQALQAARDAGVTFSAQSVGGMFGLYFREQCPNSFAEVMQCDKAAFNRFFHGMLEHGVYLAPSAFEAGFVSIAHSEADINQTVQAARQVFPSLR